MLGTFLGLFTELELTKIRSHVENLETSQNMLIHIAHTHDQQIHLLHAELSHLSLIIDTLIRYNPALVYAKLYAQVDDVAERMQILLDCVQQLQHQRLSVTLLDLPQLHTMYTSVLNVAQSKQYTLLPSKPQDFFQLDTSYVRVGADVLIFVHVPCLTDNYLLTIYKFANLPIPVSSLLTPDSLNLTSSPLAPVHTIKDLLTNFNNPLPTSPAQEAIFFVPETDMIAIGRNDGHSNRYKLLSHSDLAGCIQKNHIYLCEHHQVLRTDLEGSCLGSLYLQSERGVRENCRLDRRPLRETVYQLSPTSHLVFSPTPHTAQILCRNGSHFPIRLQSTTKIQVPPACSLRLYNHTISSDDSIRIKPESLQFTWSFNPLMLPSELLQYTTHADDAMNELKKNIATFNNITVQHDEFPTILSETLSQSSHFSVLFWSTLAIATLALGLLVFWYVGSKRRIARIRKRREIPPAYELPDSISQIAGLNLPDHDSAV